MAHGLAKRGCRGEGKSGVGSRRIFAPHFKLQVLDSYRNDADCKGNQRATARKYGIHRRQIQKWLQAEPSLRSSVRGAAPRPRSPDPAPIDLSLKRPAPPPAPPEVWDLSTRGRAPSPKLFKPYLDEVGARRPPGPPPCDALCCNNNLCDAAPYTLHELQPRAAAAADYYYAFPPAYEVPFCAGCDEPGCTQGAPLKQRHSYSLDFKLSAIECYYQDSVCRGNQRAVATKYNVHRRQVQKWLKQADELRQKNDNVKHTQTVR